MRSCVSPPLSLDSHLCNGCWARRLESLDTTLTVGDLASHCPREATQTLKPTTPAILILTSGSI